MKRILVVFLIVFGFQVHADNRMSGADGLEQAYRMLQQMRDARYELMTLWIKCELDNLCVCENKQKLYDQTSNFALKVMIESERQTDFERCQRMEEDAQYCRVEMIQQVNKAMIPCYEKFRDSLYYNDKTLHEAGLTCLAEQLQPFVAQNNPYALYVFIDYLSSHRDKYPGMIAYYDNKLKSLQNTQEYKTIQQCYDFVHN